MDTKSRPIYTLSTRDSHFRSRDTYRLKTRGQKKVLHANGNQKKAGVAILRQNRL